MIVGILTVLLASAIIVAVYFIYELKCMNELCNKYHADEQSLRNVIHSYYEFMFDDSKQYEIDVTEYLFNAQVKVVTKRTVNGTTLSFVLKRYTVDRADTESFDFAKREAEELVEKLNEVWDS